jgi:hypothetical protein
MPGSLRFGLWVALGIAVALAQTATSPGFDPTGMIYVDIARHLAAGDGIAATIYFPSHVPRVPSPISLWPPLYPAAIAAVSGLGMSAVIAARVVSIAAFGASVGLTWRVGSAVFGGGVGAAAALLLVAWPAMTETAAMALSENLFVMLVLLSVAGCLGLLHEGREPQAYARALWAGLAMAGAALTRYPGIALVPIGAAALVLNGPGRPRAARLRIAAVWSAAAALPPALLLLRNRMVTGAFFGVGRPPAEGTPIGHAVFAAKTIVVDGSKLLWRLAIAPEALGWGYGAMVLAALAGAALLTASGVRSAAVRARLTQALRAPAASREGRFLLVMGLGYWAAMLAARSVTSFEPLNTRMLMPGYPLVLVAVAGIVDAFTGSGAGTRRRPLAWITAALVAGSLTLVMLPRSVAAGGPRLRPAPPPAWVTWVAGHTPDGAPILGNLAYDFNFYLERPAYVFQVFAVYRSGNRFDRDCRLISSHLVAMGWRQVYLVLHAEDGDFDHDLMGRRYGSTIRRLLDGEPALGARALARHPQFAVFELPAPPLRCEQAG